MKFVDRLRLIDESFFSRLSVGNKNTYGMLIFQRQALYQ